MSHDTAEPALINRGPYPTVWACLGILSLGYHVAF